MKLLSSLALLLVAASSCASLSPQTCREGAWYQVGLDDGMHGQTKARLSDHAKACASVGVVVDASLWEKGRRDGLTTYCTAPSAYKIGRAGRQTGRGCSAAPRCKMQPAYDRGRQYFELTSRINALDMRRREAQGEIGSALRANNGSVTVDVFYLQGEIFDLEQRIRSLERDRRAFSTWP